MHPGVFGWWKHARRHGSCGEESAHCGPGGRGPGPGGWGGGGPFGGGDPDDLGGGSFGVRRPLRFLAYKLELDDKQVTELARILSDLKTERAQAAVDNRRSTAAFADGIAGETFDEAAVNEAAAQRVKSAERLRDAVVKALGRIHALLTPDQRGKLAYLIRTGALSI